MSSDNNGLSDDVAATLMGVGLAAALLDGQPHSEAGNLPALKRPADSAKRDAWVDYVVGLGASPEFINGEVTFYSETAWEQRRAERQRAWEEEVAQMSEDERAEWDGTAAYFQSSHEDHQEQSPKLTVAELRDLADRLGG